MMFRMKTVTIKLPVEMVARLEKEAESGQTSKSQIMREALEKHFKKSRSKKEISAFDLMLEGSGVVAPEGQKVKKQKG
jgi:predicted transcriptional regulator